ncbi:hypothetical protein B0H14DRAFT_3009119 [Mycena olivaceomarginata]|nr:hypothetical protein B0H14DRAFT_3009119 [Mycena olivaceomarginata]
MQRLLTPLWTIAALKHGRPVFGVANRALVGWRREEVLFWSFITPTCRFSRNPNPQRDFVVPNHLGCMVLSTLVVRGTCPSSFLISVFFPRPFLHACSLFLVFGDDRDSAHWRGDRRDLDSGGAMLWMGCGAGVVGVVSGACASRACVRMHVLCRWLWFWVPEGASCGQVFDFAVGRSLLYIATGPMLIILHTIAVRSHEWNIKWLPIVRLSHIIIYFRITARLRECCRSEYMGASFS